MSRRRSYTRGMTQPGDERRGDQVFTGSDSFDFGTSRSDMERMMRLRNPFVVTSDDPDEKPFIATERGQKVIAGAVFSAYWGAPVLAQLAKRAARAKARRRARAAEANGADTPTDQ